MNLWPNLDNIELYYEKEEDIEDLAEELIYKIEESIMAKEYYSYSNDGRYCYYQTKSTQSGSLPGLVEAMSLGEEYEWFMDEFGIETTLEE